MSSGQRKSGYRAGVSLVCPGGHRRVNWASVPEPVYRPVTAAVLGWRKGASARNHHAAVRTATAKSSPATLAMKRRVSAPIGTREGSIAGSGRIVERCCRLLQDWHPLPGVPSGLSRRCWQMSRQELGRRISSGSTWFPPVCFQRFVGIKNRPGGLLVRSWCSVEDALRAVESGRLVVVIGRPAGPGRCSAPLPAPFVGNFRSGLVRSYL